MHAVDVAQIEFVSNLLDFFKWLYSRNEQLANALQQIRLKND